MSIFPGSAEITLPNYHEKFAQSTYAPKILSLQIKSEKK